MSKDLAATVIFGKAVAALIEKRNGFWFFYVVAVICRRSITHGGFWVIFLA